ncbi:D-Ala-D-Ala carboxypeptidase family metallohydrolase [Minwuia sp.]|uniref:D-Ala-D-Ala carboxypeptidase family metallohydrolase n=1 Tax=Minwuia sp. TaxID=2493630 RepID=UPI003A90F4D6
MGWKVLAVSVMVVASVAGLAATAKDQISQLIGGQPPEVAEHPIKNVMVQGEELPYPVWFATSMPGEKVRFTLPSGYAMRVNGRFVSRRGAVTVWEAPDSPGVAEVTILKPTGELANRVSVFVLQPASSARNGRIDGYRIGNYPKNAPKGYIRLNNPEDANADVSPHFRIGQFLCKQQPNHWPKFVLVTPSLLKRLETVLAELQSSGRTNAKTLFVMSGFRTPFYNTAIRGAKFSRHMYGDAADVYVDAQPTDGVMDDLSGDGKISKHDANWLFDFASGIFKERKDLPRGGLGSYKANAVHGPFVHIDGRGQQARWGR